MGVTKLFFGFSGRVGRFDFWLGVAALVAVGWLVVVSLWRLGLPKPFASAIADIVVLSLFLGLAVKRGNDRGHQPSDTLLLVLGVVASSVALSLASALEAGFVVNAALSAITITLSVICIVDLGFMLAPDEAEAKVAAAPAPPSPATSPTDLATH